MENTESLPTEETKNNDNPSKINICDYCHKLFDSLDIFSCSHKICAVCLFRRIFILNITELNGSLSELTIKCNICTEGNLSKNLDELADLISKKESIFAEKNNPGSSNNDNSNKCQDHHLSKDNLCLDCSEHLCSKCRANASNEHYTHNIMNNEKVANMLKAEINNIPLKFKTKDLFDHNWNVICKKIKDSSQETFNETINKIEELTQVLADFRREYEQKYKDELTKIVKTLKILKSFYYDYYDEKEESQKGRDIDSLKYINSINSELLNLEMSKDVVFVQKINEAKIILDNLKSNDNINFTSKLIYAKLKSNYNFEYEIKGAHEKFISSIMELKDDKLLSTSFDSSIKIWEEKGAQYTPINTIKKRAGCIISALKIEDDKILTSNSSNNTIYMWVPDPNEGYKLDQTLTLHNKVVVCIIKLANGNLVTSGMDNQIIIWKKNLGGFYEEKETIKEEYPVKKLIALRNNKFGYTGDNGTLIIMGEDDGKTQENSESKNVGYEKICELKRHTGKINCMCELKNGYLFTGGAKANDKNDHYINIWKPNKETGFDHYQTLSGHKTDISDIIQLKDGRIVSSSKDRTLIIWKPVVENAEKGDIKYVMDETLSEYPHGMYGLLQLRDNRICAITSNNSLIFWRKWGSLPYC
jgi:hypothetical protein